MLSAFACSNLRFYWREGSHLFRTGSEGVQEVFGRSSGVESASEGGVDRVAAHSNVINSFMYLFQIFSCTSFAIFNLSSLATSGTIAGNSRIKFAVRYILVIIHSEIHIEHPGDHEPSQHPN